MLVKDIMTSDVVTIPSDTSLADAKRIMGVNKFKRLPVVNKDKLVGVVTEQRLERITPSKTDTINVWELSQMLEKTPVDKIMQRDVITVSPDDTVEKAVATAQENRVGALMVVKNKKLVGVATTNDFFYNIVNKVLGIGDPGTRIKIDGGGEAKDLEKIMGAVHTQKLKLINAHMFKVPKKRKKDVVVHVNTENVKALVKDLEKSGYKTSLIKR